jgi:hypothetical protein
MSTSFLKFVFEHFLAFWDYWLFWVYFLFVGWFGLVWFDLRQGLAM